MKASSHGFVRVVVVLLASATLGLAQTSGRYYGAVPYQNQTVPATQSVRPGALNYVEGQVTTDGQPVSPQSVGHVFLQPGQTLETANGYAEVLLTPGAFLRIGPNSEIQMSSAGLADARVKIIHGQSLIEADQVIKGTRLETTIGSNTAEVLKKGLYEFNADRQTVKVLDGKLRVSNAQKSRDIGKGDQVALNNGDNLKKSDFEVSQAKQDPLYVWSEARSQDEAGENLMVAQNAYGYIPVNGGWFWDPYVDYWGFWPESAYLYSPFGFGFYGGWYGGYYGYPGLVYARPIYGGYHRWHYGNAAGIHAYGGFHGGSYGGFHSGGFHGGGGRR